MALTAGCVRDRASPHFPQTSVGGDVMTGGCVSMFFMKSCVIFSSSSTSFMFRGTPPPLPAVEGVAVGGLFGGWMKDAGGGVTVLVGGALGGAAAAWFALS